MKGEFESNLNKEIATLKTKPNQDKSQNFNLNEESIIESLMGTSTTKNQKNNLNNQSKNREDDILSFNLKRNSHKTKAKGGHIQKTKKRHISSHKEDTELTSTSLNANKDNLQLIKGIGKVLEETLNKLNIYQFQQIANWSDNEISKVNTALSFSGRIEREEWRNQAKELAKDKKTEFSERVEKGDVPTSKK